ncbi:MAG: LAGLIDADG family homing endonuclease [Deltaproteobacteria bacterium]|nr:LAGLIDADG family homing endonuclease [Deltaproteobacteria bacterium]
MPHGNLNREPWNKGLTKYTHPSVLKISKTLSLQTTSNFSKWQQKNKRYYAQLKQGIKLAELYGVLLGDGYIEKLPRTERLIISFHSREKRRIHRIDRFIGNLFKTKPKIRNRLMSHCIDVYLYQKNISQRLGFPTGKKASFNLHIPRWVKKSDKYLLKCLKGLFESDGDLCIDKKYQTNVIKFTNTNQTLLDDVHQSLVHLGYHPQRRMLDVRLAQKKEVTDFVHRIDFRKV